MFLFDCSQNIDSGHSKKLQYDYYSTTINKNEIVNAQPDSSYNLQMTFVQPSSSPNFIYPDATHTYKTSTLHIFKLIHDNIIGTTCQPNGQLIQEDKSGIVGELVIEHKEITGTNTLFVCFLLKVVATDKNDKTKTNDIDKLLNLQNTNEPTLQVKLNGLIPGNGANIVYTSGSKTVIVFTEPILINEKNKSMLQQLSRQSAALFEKEPANSKYIVISNETKDDNKSNKNREGFSTQIGDDQIYIDCNPTGESAEKISTYNVPINSEYTRDAGKLDFMKITVNLCIVIILMIITYFSVPIVYKAVVIDSINKFLKPLTKEETGYDESNVLVRVRSADILITMICLGIFIAIINYDQNDYNMVLLALYVGILYGLSFSTLQFHKLVPSFMKTRIGEKIVGELYPDDKMDPDKQPKYYKIMDVLKLFFQSLLFALEGNRGYNFIAMIVLSIVTLIVLLGFWLFNKITLKQLTYWLTVTCVFAIFPLVPAFGITMRKVDSADKNVEKTDATTEKLDNNQEDKEPKGMLSKIGNVFGSIFG